MVRWVFRRPKSELQSVMTRCVNDLGLDWNERMNKPLMKPSRVAITFCFVVIEIFERALRGMRYCGYKVLFAVKDIKYFCNLFRCKNRVIDRQSAHLVNVPSRGHIECGAI